jgi:hypothetical protein
MENIDVFLKKYYKDIKNTFPLYGKNEKIYFQNFQDCIQDYLANNETSDITPEKIIEEFGTPTEIISEYLANVDCEYLTKNIRRTNHLKKALFIIIFLLVTAWIYRSVILYLAYEDAKMNDITFEETVIEEY